MHRITLAAAALAVTAQLALSFTVTAHASTQVATAANHTSAAQLDSYWTADRLAQAKPITPPVTGPATKPAGPVAGTERFVPATAPAGHANKASVEASVWVTIGRLVFSVPGKGDYLCSANVVSSNNHDVISTARHCVMDIGTGQTYTNFRFAPSYNKGSAPYGWWNWRSMGWRTDDTGPGGDNAFIVLATGGNNGGHVQDAVGSSGIAFNASTNNYAHGVGLPGDKDYAVWCGGQPYDGPSGGVQIPGCVGLSGGASGGAFIVNYQNDGSAVQTASFFGSWGDSYFAYYRDVAWQVYNGAQNA